MDFRVDLEVFRGPLDLLLYLVRKHEVEIVDIPIAPITTQFLEYLALLEQLDVNAAGDFLDMASTLVEIKSRMVLPRGGEIEEPLSDPRQELVQRLLEYRKFKDAANMLDEHGRRWQERFGRQADDARGAIPDKSEQEIQEVELWDLVSAFGRILRDVEAIKPSQITYDETPIHVHMTFIKSQLLRRGRLKFAELFQPGMHKSALIGLFLAVLELVRHKQAQAEQDALFGEIWILPGPQIAAQVETADIEEYEHRGN